ncbi:hypothetical protein BASA81_012583 [Batrachochytrium salamandrivorans]|nr:hypothetical protein BASA81_012583 [Batrachochytrium salamandrivorans]
MWRTAVPNQHVDEQTKRNYVLEVSRRLNLTRREIATAAQIQEFRYMNYWIRGKESDKEEVKRAGARLYTWAVSTDSRVAVPMSREEEEILRAYQQEKKHAQEEAVREKQEKLARTQQARAKLHKEKQANEAKLKKEREAAAASAAAATAMTTASTTSAVPTRKRVKLVSEPAPAAAAAAAAAAVVSEEEETSFTADEGGGTDTSMTWESPRRLPTIHGVSNSPPLRTHRRDSLFYHNPLLGSSPMVSRSSYEDTPTRMGSNETSVFPNESPLSLTTPNRRSMYLEGSGFRPFAAPMSATPLRMRVVEEDAQHNNPHHPQHLATTNLLNAIPDVFHGHDLPDATPTSTPQQPPVQPPPDAAPRSSARKLDF